MCMYTLLLLLLVYALDWQGRTVQLSLTQCAVCTCKPTACTHWQRAHTDSVHRVHAVTRTQFTGTCKCYSCICSGTGACACSGTGACACIGTGACACIGKGECACIGTGACACRGTGACAYWGTCAPEWAEWRSSTSSGMWLTQIQIKRNSRWKETELGPNKIVHYFRTQLTDV